MSDTLHFLNMAIELARANIAAGGRPFGAVLVRDGQVLATGVNEILTSHDPTAHAELMAVRAASRKLGSPDRAAARSASGHPCPMCMAAMRLAGIREVAYAYSNDDARPTGCPRRRSTPIWPSPSKSSPCGSGTCRCRSRAGPGCMRNGSRPSTGRHEAMTRAGTRAGNPAPAGLLLAAIALVALNLRPFIAGIGPLAADIGAHTGLDLKRMSLLTLVPMLLMGLVAFAGPAVQARLGGRRAVLLALALLAAGSSLRLASAGWQLIGTAAMLGLGAAVVQAVLPGIIKRQFPRHVGVVMGLYSSMLMAGGALGAQLSPLAAAASGDWRIGLAWMAVPALLALALAARSLPPDEAVRSAWRPRRAAARLAADGLLRPGQRRLFVGGGVAGAVLSGAGLERGGQRQPARGPVCQAAAALLLPVLARKHEDRRPWLWLTLVLQAAGFAALAWRPDAAPIAWAMLLGAGLGGCFALSLIVALDHLPDPLRAGVLSSYVQGGGFLIAAAPPWIVAALREATGAFATGAGICILRAVVAALYRGARAVQLCEGDGRAARDAARAGSGGS